MKINYAYCENEACRVVTFEVKTEGDKTEANCPGCGEFGRTKGK